MTLLVPGLPSPATLLLNTPHKGFNAINRLPITIDSDDENHKALVKRQSKIIRNMILPEIILFFSYGIL